MKASRRNLLVKYLSLLIIGSTFNPDASLLLIQPWLVDRLLDSGLLFICIYLDDRNFQHESGEIKILVSFHIWYFLSVILVIYFCNHSK